MPNFDEYAKNTDRVIPVVVLEPGRLTAAGRVRARRQSLTARRHSIRAVAAPAVTARPPASNATL